MFPSRTVRSEALFPYRRMRRRRRLARPIPEAFDFLLSSAGFDIKEFEVSQIICSLSAFIVILVGSWSGFQCVFDQRNEHQWRDFAVRFVAEIYVDENRAVGHAQSHQRYVVFDEIGLALKSGEFHVLI